MQHFECWRCEYAIPAKAPDNVFYTLQCPHCGAKFTWDASEKQVVQITRSGRLRRMQ